MKGYITRARVGPGALAAIVLRDADRDAGHALVWSLFQGQAKGDRPFLYKQEGEGAYLIVSTVPPTDDTALWTLETKPYAPALSAGEALAYSLRVNPARTYRTPEGAMRRTDVVMHAKARIAKAKRAGFDIEEPLRDWLTPRLADRGAALDAMAVTRWEAPQVFKGDAQYRRGQADLRGVLTVTDPEAFTACLFAGLGKARAYGCGLMLVRRL